MADEVKISDAVYAELTATCDALGYNDGSKFNLDKNAIEVLKDLIRYLKRDDDKHSVRRYLGHSKLLQRDLLQIFVEHANKIELWNVLLRLMINLTSPALMMYNEELPTEKVARSFYLQILSHLQEYKTAMANDAMWSIIHEKMKNILTINSEERGEENEMIMERILILIRNVLRVPASDSENRTDNDTSIHDEVLFALNTTGITDLLVYIASSSKEQQYHMQILEIIALMLQRQNPARLAKVGMERSNLEKEAEEARLLDMRQKEQIEKLAKMKKYAGSRHSRFGGTFVVQNMKAVGDNEMICHKPYQKIEDLNFSVTKQKTKKRKNKNELTSLGEERISALAVRLFLKEFCVEFLNGAYNPVMRYVRSCINAGTEASDASHYLWALRFFMNFNRHYNFRVKYVSETISTEVFYIVQRQIEHNYEMILTDKKKAAFWSTRMHLGINAYQELLFTLIEMDKSTDSGVKRSSRAIMGNIFYVPEYRDTILSQLLNYNELIMSRDYLVDLVTTVHIFLKMLKNFCEKERNIVVQKVRRKKPKKKSKPANNLTTQPTAPLPSLEERWDELGPEVSAVMQQNEIPTVAPFDGASEVSIDDQKGDAMKRIQKLLRCKDYEQAIGLLRSARDVWPENDSFGRIDVPVEEEFLILREIFFVDLGVPDELPVTQASVNQIEALLNHEDENDDDEDNEEEDNEPRFEETSFKFMDFLQRFANMRIVSNLAILLKNFEKNTPELNHYVLKMFHRIALDCKMPAMMYQASIFRVFQRIFQSDNRIHKELAAFGRFVFRGFAEVAKRNPKAYMELLFWKSTKQATEMTDGYDAEPQSKKASKIAWSEAEEEELRTLFMEHQTNKPSQDLVDYILSNLISQDRTRRGVMKKLKEMYLIVNSKSVRNEVSKRLPKEWSEEEVAQLTELWEQVREEDDPVGLIYESLRIKRSKPKIKEKLLELNLAEDAKQLRKKRTKKSSGPKSSWENPSASENEDGSDLDDDGDDNDGVDNRTDVRKKNNKKQKKSSQGRKKSKQPVIVYTDAQLSGLLKDVIDHEMQEALQWLKESLEESLEDRDEESNEGLALVPLTTETSAAMDSPNFQRFLRGAGIEPPDLEEAYWRIPARMLVSTIKKRIEIIDKALKGEFLEEVPAASKGRYESESEDDDDFFEKLKKYTHRNEDDADSTPSNTQKSAASESRTRKVNENLESSETDEETQDTENEILSNEKYAPKSKRIKTVLDTLNSSDSEDDQRKSSQDTTKSSQDTKKSSQDTTKSSQDTKKSSQDTKKSSQDTTNSSQDTTKSSQDTAKSSQDTRKSSQDTAKSSQDTRKSSQYTTKSSQGTMKSSAEKYVPKPKRIKTVVDTLDSSDSEDEPRKSSQDTTKSPAEKYASKPKRIKTVLDTFDSSDSENEQHKSSQKEEDINGINVDSSQDKTNRSKRVLQSDSEEEKMETESQSQTDVRSKIESKEGNAKSSRIRKVLYSDSEEEAEKVSLDADESSLELKRTRAENSGDESSVQKKRRVLLESDEEADVVQETEQ